tara:strand:- start:42 stop:284 length:243 start_codon:yes stop_codon:yes gene_type:complete
MYYVYGASKSRATNRAEFILYTTKTPYRLFLLNKDYTIKQLSKMVPNTKTIPQVFKQSQYVGGLKELYDQLYSDYKGELL